MEITNCNHYLLRQMAAQKHSSKMKIYTTTEEQLKEKQ